MPVDFNQIRDLLSAIAQTDIAELTIKSENFELTVRKGMSVMPSSTMAQPPAQATPPALEATTPAQSPAQTSAPPAKEEKLVEITSPMVGTFYRAPAPGEPPFVEVGDRVQANQPVCIIEAMKLMNEIEAEVSGQVVSILVENGEPVEYGQPLMQIKPD